MVSQFWVGLPWPAVSDRVALTISFLINAAILVLATLVFYGRDSLTVAGPVVEFGPDFPTMPTCWCAPARSP